MSLKYRVLFVVLVVIFFNGTGHVKAQESFEDHVQNPVFTYSGVTGLFDQNRVFAHDVIKVGAEYKMFYSGVGDGNSVQIGLATSSDGISWNRVPQNPVFECAENTGPCLTGGVWSNFRVSVVTVEYKDNEYRMWYQGDNQNLYSIKKLGFATSPDGIHWTASTLNPVFIAKDRTGIRYLSVLPIKSGYRLYFGDAIDKGFYYLDSTDGMTWDGVPVKLGDERVHTVAVLGDEYIAVVDSRVATSSDGLDFDFSKSTVIIGNNSGPDEAKVEFMLEDDIVKTWRVHYLGNVIWSYGNFAINYATLSSDDLIGDEPEPENKYPLYTQKVSPYPSVEETASWADDIYADGTSYCGKGNTIAYCGCAITSLVMAGRHAGITTDIVGENVDPGNMNEWLASVGGYTSGGYLWWLAGQAYFGELSGGEFGKGGEIRSRFAEYDSTSVNTKTFIDEALAAGDKAVLGYKNGHYVWVTEKTADSYLLNDPSWYLTKTAIDTKADNVRNYGNTFDVAHSIKITDEPVLLTGGSIESYITGTAELLYEDALGNKVGYEEGVVVVDLDRSWYGQNVALSNEEENVSSDVKHLLIQQAGEIGTIEVVGTGVGEYKFEFYALAADGEITTFAFSGLTFPGVTTTFTFDLETGEIIEQAISYEDFLKILDVVLVDLSPQQKQFFDKWAKKIFDNMEDKTVSQTLQSIDVFQKLLAAKKVDSPVLLTVLEKLSAGVK